MRVMGLDLGGRRIGVALSDPTRTLASPFTTIVRADDETTMKALAALAAEHQATMIVVGLPLMLKGGKGIEANRAEDFARRLAGYTDVKVVTWDERLTTVTADRLLREAGAGYEERRRKQDATAAALILQGFLDHLKGDALCQLATDTSGDENAPST